MTKTNRLCLRRCLNGQIELIEMVAEQRDDEWWWHRPIIFNNSLRQRKYSGSLFYMINIWGINYKGIKLKWMLMYCHVYVTLQAMDSALLLSEINCSLSFLDFTGFTIGFAHGTKSPRLAWQRFLCFRLFR